MSWELPQGANLFAREMPYYYRLLIIDMSIPSLPCLELKMQNLTTQGCFLFLHRSLRHVYAVQ